ncbi:MAG: hypothetical protein F4X98_09820 [Gammaproteobacteria bacterium]|nr:hypothetical protein [Gammaproteobacteria bacterium]
MTNTRIGKRAGLVAAAVFALGLFAGNAQAEDDETSYQFRLVNDHVRATHIRCGSSGNWTTVGISSSSDISCSGTSAQTKLGEGNALDWTYNCSANNPIKRIRYHGYYVAGSLKSYLYDACVAS